jgi:glycosyltransferase involved in cell wall biosynthesis
MRNNKFKVLLFIDIFFLLFFIFYKFYLYFLEDNYTALNVENMNKIEKIRSHDLNFAIIGNIKNSIIIFEKKIIPLLNSQKVDFVISLGNAVANNGEDKYRLLYRSLKFLKSPFINVVGVNECSNGSLTNYYKHFGPLFFSFMKNDKAFIFLDNTGITPFLYIKKWVSEELMKYQHCKNIFVFMNRPIYLPKDVHYFGDLEEYVVNDGKFNEYLIKLFSKFKVTAVFASNLGLYDEREIKGVRYYISGGAGGFILEEDDNYYHYLRVSVNKHGNVNINKIDIDYKYTNYFIKQVENLWFQIHSLFYIGFINFIIIIALLSIIAIYFYNKINEDVEYYQDYSFNYDALQINKPLNIAMFTNNYFPFIGGVPVAIYRLAKGLKRIGENPVIFAPLFRGDYRDDETIEVIRLKNLGYYKKFHNIPVVNIFSPRIRKIFEKKNIQIVHVHHPFWMGKKGLRLAKIYNCPLVLTYHTRLEKYAHYVPINNRIFKNFLSHLIIKNFARKCDLIIAPTLDAKDYLRNIGVKTQIEVIPTGVDFELYRSVDSNEIDHLHSMYRSGKEFILLSVSRLSKEKNLYFLIDGIIALKKITKIAFKLLIIGDGEEKEHIEKYVNAHGLSEIVFFVGAVEPTKLCKYYMFSDIFVFASTSETQGLVLLEAMAGKNPVVAIRSSGIDDIIINEYNGFKTAENTNEWALKIKYIMENKSICEKLSENAFEYSKKYTLENIADRIAKLYTKLLYDRENT